VMLLKGLSPSSLKEFCEAGETAARQFVLSKLDKKLIRSLDIQVMSEKKRGSRTTFNVEVFIDVEPAVEIDAGELAAMATDAALSAIDEKMRGRKVG